MTKIQELLEKISGWIGSKIIPPDSVLGRFWWFLTTPGDEMVWWWKEVVETGLLLVAVGSLLFYMLGARGKVSRCLYWAVALFIVLKILF